MNYKGKRRKAARASILLFIMTAMVLAATVCSICFAKDNEPEPAVIDVVDIPTVTTTVMSARYATPEARVLAAAPVATPVIAESEEEQARVYANISLDEELQLLVWQACEETGCPYELALSVIYCESSYRNVNGDGGNSIGYMQIQPRWHQARMEKLGVTDLSDPLSNFRVGCDLLAELLDKHSVEDALSVYNTGGTGHRKYANKVLGYMEETFE